MVKMMKSALLWQLTLGFALGTAGISALAPADASPARLLFANTPGAH